jgi:hypothetical protein
MPAPYLGVGEAAPLDLGTVWGPDLHQRERDDRKGAPAAPGEVVENPFRVEFFLAYLAEAAKACQEGVVIKSYFASSFLDNWEWALGYRGDLDRLRQPAKDSVCEALGVCAVGEF